MRLSGFWPWPSTYKLYEIIIFFGFASPSVGNREILSILTCLFRHRWFLHVFKRSFNSNRKGRSVYNIFYLSLALIPCTPNRMKSWCETSYNHVVSKSPIFHIFTHSTSDPHGVTGPRRLNNLGDQTHRRKTQSMVIFSFHQEWLVVLHTYSFLSLTGRIIDIPLILPFGSSNPLLWKSVAKLLNSCGAAGQPTCVRDTRW